MWGRRIVLSLGSSPLLEEGEEREELFSLDVGEKDY